MCSLFLDCCISYPTVILTFSWYTVFTNKEMMTKSQQYNCFIRNGGNAIPKHAGPEAKGSSPTTGHTLLWARNPFRGNFNHWQVSRKEIRQIFFKPRQMLDYSSVINFVILAVFCCTVKN